MGLGPQRVLHLLRLLRVDQPILEDLPCEQIRRRALRLVSKPLSRIA